MSPANEDPERQQAEYYEENAIGQRPAKVRQQRLIVRGIGQSLIVVALGVMTVDRLDKAELGSASRLLFAMRNVGGAIGIAMSSQIVIERTKLHTDRIGEAITHYSSDLHERMIQLVRLLCHLQTSRDSARGGISAVPQQAFVIINERIRHEALLLTYSAAFFLAGVSMLACAGCALLLKRTGRG